MDIFAWLAPSLPAHAKKEDYKLDLRFRRRFIVSRCRDTIVYLITITSSRNQYFSSNAIDKNSSLSAQRKIICIICQIENFPS